jgi:hypothetical protein
MKFILKVSIILFFISFMASVSRAEEISRLHIATSLSLVYDPVSNRIYAGLAGSSYWDGDSIAFIDPFSGKVELKANVGNGPVKLALSHDSKYLYVALHGTGTVKRFLLPSLTPDLEFDLGSDPYSTQRSKYYARDMYVLPGSSESVVVSRYRPGGSGFDHGGVAVYDNGVKRKLEVEDWRLCNDLIPSGRSSHLYCTSSFGLTYFLYLTISDEGIEFSDVTDQLIRGWTQETKFDSGKIYTSMGQVADPETREQSRPFLIGNPSDASVLPDSASGRIYFLLRDETYTHLRIFSIYSGEEIAKLDLTRITSGRTWNLIKWGIDGLAFRDDKHVILIRTPWLLPPSPNSGDLDANGKIDVRDAIFLLKFLIQSQPLTETQRRAGDLNGDGTIDVEDAVGILRYTVGLPISGSDSGVSE